MILVHSHIRRKAWEAELIATNISKKLMGENGADQGAVITPNNSRAPAGFKQVTADQLLHMAGVKFPHGS